MRRKEALMVYLKGLSQHLPGRTEENYENYVRIGGHWAKIQI
jgi:hypothetical protein